MAIINVTSNADSGAGTLRQAIADAQNGDEIRFSEDVFERGVRIEILLATKLVFSKDLTLNADPFRVVLSGGCVSRVVEILSGANVTFNGFDFVNGKHRSSGGGVYAQGGATLNRCRVCGCSAKQGAGLTLSSDGDVVLRDSAVYGNSPTDYDDGVFVGYNAQRFEIVRSTVVGKIGGKLSTIVASDSLIADDAENCGFVAPPSADYSVETWTPESWREMDLRLFDDGNASPSERRDSITEFDVDEVAFDLDGNLRGRTQVVDGEEVATRSPGAFETVQADLFWIGKDVDGNAVSTASWSSASGWATSRFANVSNATAAPSAGQTIFVGENVAFVDAPPEGSENVYSFLRVGGGNVVLLPSPAELEYKNVDVSLGVGARLSLTGTPPNLRLRSKYRRELGPGAELEIPDEFVPAASVALTLGGQAVPLSTAATATVRGDAIVEHFLNVGTLTLGANATLTFQPANADASPFLCADELNFRDGAQIDGDGYLATRTTIGTPSVSDDVVWLTSFGASVSEFSATADGPTSARLVWAANDSTKPIVLERNDGDRWTLLDDVANGTTATADLVANGETLFRLWDGETFFVDSAWFVSDFYRCETISTRIPNVAKLETKNEGTKLMFVNGDYPRIRENCRVNSRIKSGLTGTLVARADVASIVATVRRVGKALGTRDAEARLIDEYTVVPGWDAVELPTTNVLETPIVPDDLAAVETEGFNFIWTPDVSVFPIFPSEGEYWIQIDIALKNGEKVYLSEKVDVKM